MKQYLSLIDLFYMFGPDYLSFYGDRMPPSHRKTIEAILSCRTPSLGGQMYLCPKCEKTHPVYHSCNNRHCPQCGGDKVEQWIQKQFDRLLPVPYFFVTFTVPEQLRALFRSNQSFFYDLFFETSSQALKDVASNPRFVGGQIGFEGVLQTWARDLSYHPHIHYIVPGAGLSKDGKRWVKIKNKRFLLHVHPLSQRFKHLFYKRLEGTALFDSIPKSVWTSDWVVHCESAGYGREVIQYVAPYIFKVAMTNQTLLILEDNKVTFAYKENGTDTKKFCTAGVFELMRRFLQHVLPNGFMKVRYFGFLGANQINRIRLLRMLILQSLSRREQRAFFAVQCEISKRQLVCPHCGTVLILLGSLPRIYGPDP